MSDFVIQNPYRLPSVSDMMSVSVFVLLNLTALPKIRPRASIDRQLSPRRDHRRGDHSLRDGRMSRQRGEEYGVISPWIDQPVGRLHRSGLRERRADPRSHQIQVQAKIVVLFHVAQWHPDVRNLLFKPLKVFQRLPGFRRRHPVDR